MTIFPTVTVYPGFDLVSRIWSRNPRASGRVRGDQSACRGLWSVQHMGYLTMLGCCASQASTTIGPAGTNALAQAHESS